MVLPAALPLTRLSLRQVLLLSAIDDSGSLKQAAATIGMSQPRASKSVQEIEDLMGHRLFNRTNRGLSPTTAGEVVIRHAKTMMAQLSTLQQELSSLATGSWRRLRIGTIMGAVPIVSDVVQRYLERYPQTSVEIMDDTSAELLRMLDRGVLDLVIGRTSVSATLALYDTQILQQETLTVVANPAHPLVGRRRVRLEDLREPRWIVYTAGMPMRLSLEQEYRHAGLPFPRNLLETRSGFTTMSLLQSSPNAIALLSSDAAAFLVDFGIARTLPVHLSARSEPYEVITLRAGTLPEHVRDFIAVLRDDQHGDWAI
ncbi:LysR family transcriptional regulator [Ketogulonicigenium vulgare]|uniref:Putative transcriptional regulator, LysR family protein n=2 Tax=Ketogulonicigenium vulgare TaxID=92945 RepID=F9Y514_KETVW|nr:LysR family transcriptional regulator [Ketogulonicigenium vulgare]AEM40646.1 putative transcriptional regulator, LysR family protein [Ketogulonicigenium vulgare WSH-001]ALJ80819.1 LysR family transcriptional regulator [Ketogulonicigenium vulgare]ANW33598.1 LysR family transcriptional regulator [Ketogulonicigenium vulgare]AOZ54360.1 putative transcriptional regulator, LysR family protein [Ketogulonicigenium vulgare]